MSATDDADSGRLAEEWQAMIQRAIDRLGAPNDPAVLRLAQLIVEVVRDYQAKTPALTEDHVHLAFDLAIQSLEKAERE